MLTGCFGRLNVQGAVRLATVGDADHPASWLLHAACDGKNRAVLMGTLRTPYKATGKFAAAALLHYRQAGEQAIQRLEGDFALLLWDAHTRTLLAQRDPLGGFPLYWTTLSDGSFALDTSLSRLAVNSGREVLDARYFHAYLCASESHNNELDTVLTPYCGIERVLPGETLAFVPGARRPKRLAYWSWVESVGSIQVGDQVMAAGKLREILERVVHAHLRVGGAMPAASHLSGGMDSTTLCALAARDRLMETPARLHGLSLVYEQSAALAGETDCIQEAVTAIGCTPHFVPADRLRAFDGIAEVPAHDEPAALSLLSQDENGLVEAAAGAGCRVVLSGCGADALFAPPPWHLTDHLRRLHLFKLWSQAWRSAEGQNAGLRAVLWHQAVLPFFRGLPAAACRGSIHEGPWAAYEGRRPPPWMRRDFLHRHKSQVQGDPHERLTRQWGMPARAALSMVRAHRGNWHKWYVGVPRGIAVTYPFLDPTVVIFALACLEQLPYIPSRVKPLLADAVGSLLPPRIARRREKIDYDDVFYGGLIANLQELERLAQLPELADLGALEPRILVDCLRQTALGMAPSAPATNRLSKALALARWLELRPAALEQARQSARDLSAMA